MNLIAAIIPISASLFFVGSVAVLFLAAFLLSGLFGPMPEYQINDRDQLPSSDSPEFLNLLESLVDAKVNDRGTVKVLKDGPCFYSAELEAIGINDEVNLAVSNTRFAMQLEHEMAIDLTKSHRVSLDEWRHRPITERVPELLGWIFERQQ